jgi:hypothetical protein
MRCVEKYGTVEEARDDNIIRDMRFGCWIAQATNTLRISNKKININFALEQAMKAQRKNRAIVLSLTSAIDGGGWLTPRLGRFTPRKETRYPLHSRLIGPQGLCGREQKI